MRCKLYHRQNLIVSPLYGHGEVANENPLILPSTLSIVGALVLLKRRAGKKMRAPLLDFPKSIYYYGNGIHIYFKLNIIFFYHLFLLGVIQKPLSSIYELNYYNH